MCSLGAELMLTRYLSARPDPSCDYELGMIPSAIIRQSETGVRRGRIKPPRQLCHR